MANDKSILSTAVDYASNYFSPPSQDEELEKQIAEAEANNESAEVIQALIADSEAEKQKLGTASIKEQQEESFSERRAREEEESTRVEDMHFKNHGHIT